MPLYLRDTVDQDSKKAFFKEMRDREFQRTVRKGGRDEDQKNR